MATIAPYTISKNDALFAQWVAAHPNGFVVNGYDPPEKSYLVLHQAQCKHINGAHGKSTTCSGYSKTVSESADDLKQWAKDLGGTLSLNCGCKP